MANNPFLFIMLVIAVIIIIFVSTLFAFANKESGMLSFVVPVPHGMMPESRSVFFYLKHDKLMPHNCCSWIVARQIDITIKLERSYFTCFYELQQFRLVFSLSNRITDQMHEMMIKTCLVSRGWGLGKLA